LGPPAPVLKRPDGQVVTNDDPQGNRRSMYLQVRRSQGVTLLELFDTPRMEINCARRSEAVVAPQALAMLNSKFVEANAQVLAARIIRTAGRDQDARIDCA